MYIAVALAHHSVAHLNFPHVVGCVYSQGIYLWRRCSVSFSTPVINLCSCTMPVWHPISWPHMEQKYMLRTCLSYNFIGCGSIPAKPLRMCYRNIYLYIYLYVCCNPELTVLLYWPPCDYWCYESHYTVYQAHIKREDHRLECVGAYLPLQKLCNWNGSYLLWDLARFSSWSPLSVILSVSSWCVLQSRSCGVQARSSKWIGQHI